MRMLLLFVLMTAAALNAAEAVNAGPLKFALLTATHVAAPDDTAFDTTFAFTNTGNHVVSITGVRASCGCTTAKADQTLYASGAHGVLDVSFVFGNRGGPQHKTITIITDDPQQPRVELTLEVTLPAAPVISHGDLVWRLGEVPAPRAVAVSIPDGCPYRLAGVDGTDAFAVATVAATAKDLRFTVVPRAAAKPATDAITVRTTGARTFTLWVAVKDTPAISGKIVP